MAVPAARPTPGERPSAGDDGNLLFGLLALQLDFIARAALIEGLHGWLREKSRPLGQILVEHGDLTPARRLEIDALVEEHLAAHAQDPSQSVAALTVSEADLHALTSSVADAGVQASLATILIASSAGLATPFRTVPAATGSMRYRILRPHARGGLGEVFVAHDEELRREVALKCIQEHKAQDPASRSRFVMEAEITGGLEHPGIVPVYGLGQYADGRPYYAMRFIRGDNLKEAIDRFHRENAVGADSRKRNLALRELLGRFLDVCQAVAYAHSRGVLHRDLKPGNVMLGRYGETLVVDWGLAKSGIRSQGFETRDSTKEGRLEPGSAGDSAPTQAGTALGTPGFMSPEQADGRIDQLGPASDVYSLGATLYALLIGKPPFVDTDVGCVLKRVRNGDFVAPRQVNKAVAPALDAICRKAMSLRPEDRYGSALELAADVENWLADETVSAYREPWWPRLARWARRHRPLVAGGAALLLTAVVALSVGIVVVDRERQRTVLEQGKTEEALQAESIARQSTREALDQMSSQVIEDWLARRTELEPAQKAFLEKALDYYESFAASTGEREDLRSSVANAYLRIGNIRKQLGQHEDAERAFRQALADFETLTKEFPAEPAYRQGLVNGHFGVGSLHQDAGQSKEAEEHYLDALAMLTQLTADFPGAPPYRQGLARAQTNLANLWRSTRPKEAEGAYIGALAIQKELAAEFPNEPVYRLELARSHEIVGALRGATGRPKNALKDFRAALAVLKQLNADFPGVAAYHHELGMCYYGQGSILSDPGWKREAEEAYQNALVIQRQLAADYPSVPLYRQDLARTHNNLGRMFERTGRIKDALASARDALAIKKHLAADFPAVVDYRADLGRSYLNLGINLMDAGQARQAEEALNEALSICRDLSRLYPETADHQDAVIQTRSFLALLWAGSGDYMRAMAEVKELEAGPHLSAANLYDLACVCTRSSAAVRKDKKLSTAEQSKLSDQYAVRGVGFLSRALKNGYNDVANLQKDTDLDHLRGRADFKRLVQPLEKAPSPGLQQR
jgi:serine/threonine-protein kinase